MLVLKSMLSLSNFHVTNDNCITLFLIDLSRGAVEMYGLVYLVVDLHLYCIEIISKNYTSKYFKVSIKVRPWPITT